jgi:hypothetical protein
MQNLEPAKDIMNLTMNILGSTNPVTIDSGIYQHYFYDEFPDSIEENGDIHIIEASKENPIDIKAIYNVVNNINGQFETLENLEFDGRSYFYEGLNFNSKESVWRIHWGS